MRALNHGQEQVVDALDPAARSILAEGRQLHVGVCARSGPHVTPELYAAVGDDIWFATAAGTLKSKVLRRDDRLSGLVRVGSRSVTVVGTAETFDLADPLRLAGQAREGLRALQGLTSFAMRNAADLTGFARDLVAGRLPSRRPPRRVLVRLRPDDSLTLDGTALVAASGGWPGSADPVGDAPPLPGRRDAVVGWETDAGVLLLPARAESQTAAAVPAVAAHLAGVEPDRLARACLTTDDYAAPGPAAKTGTLLRGEGTLRYDGSIARLELAVERETTWDGAETRTERRPAS
jgi:hypothetical protein